MASWKVHAHFVAAILMLLLFVSSSGRSEDSEEVDPGDAFEASQNAKFEFSQDSTFNQTHFLVYGVNPGEGFNLRRDVYVRVANLVKMARDAGQDWVLVLPPWRRLYHWRTRIDQNALPWKTFFDIKNLNKYVPVIEFDEFVHHTGSSGIDQIYYLQRHKDQYKGGYKELQEIEECEKKPTYEKDESGNYKGYFWGLKHVYGKAFNCLSVQGTCAVLKEVLLAVKVRSVMIDRFEAVMHSRYGGHEFWRARRSLVFAKHIRNAGDEFRAKFLNSTDENDLTPYNDEDWRKQIPVAGSANGGPYLAVHFRRHDYLYAHKQQTPSVENAALQINKLLADHSLNAVFIASDTTDEEFMNVSSLIDAPVFRYRPPLSEIERVGDGGVAVTDQWIAAHGRHFVGSCLSTFSFRIHEERDILGFNEKNTYNCLCGDDELGTCEQPTKWRVKFD